MRGYAGCPTCCLCEHRPDNRSQSRGARILATELWTLAPNIFCSAVRNLLHCTFLAPRILRWLLGSRKIFAYPCQGNEMLGVQNGLNCSGSQNGRLLVTLYCMAHVVLLAASYSFCVCVCARAHCCTRTALPTSYPSSQPLATNRFTHDIQRNVQRSPTSCPQCTYSSDTARGTTGELIRRWL